MLHICSFVLFCFFAGVVCEGVCYSVSDSGQLWFSVRVCCIVCCVCCVCEYVCCVRSCVAHLALVLCTSECVMMFSSPFLEPTANVLCLCIMVHTVSLCCVYPLPF